MKSELGCESRAWFLDSAIPLSHCGTLLMHLPLYENSGSLLFHKRIALSDSSAPECTITYMCSVLHNLQTSLTSICSFIPPLCESLCCFTGEVTGSQRCDIINRQCLQQGRAVAFCASSFCAFVSYKEVKTLYFDSKCQCLKGVTSLGHHCQIHNV